MDKKKILLVGIFLTYTVIEAHRFPFFQEYEKEDTLNKEHAIDSECDALKKERFITISLGENCFPALHLRLYGIRIRSFPFDWDITPFSALYDILSNDFEGFIDLQNLAINQKENTIFNKRYHFKLNHDFDIKDWFDGPNGLTPRNDLSLKKYQKVCSYYYRRISRFYEAFDLTVPLYLFRRVINAEQAKQLNTLLTSKFPRSNFTLVCIQDEKWDTPSVWKTMPPHVKYYRLPHPIDPALEQKGRYMKRIFQDLKLIE